MLKYYRLLHGEKKIYKRELAKERGMSVGATANLISNDSWSEDQRKTLKEFDKTFKASNYE